MAHVEHHGKCFAAPHNEGKYVTSVVENAYWFVQSLLDFQKLNSRATSSIIAVKRSEPGQQLGARLQLSVRGAGISHHAPVLP